MMVCSGVLLPKNITLNAHTLTAAKTHTIVVTAAAAAAAADAAAVESGDACCRYRHRCFWFF